MKIVVHNDNNLTDADMEETVVRIKALLINGDYIYLANADDTYQFPGGHLEENESYEECLKREVFEETGIIINNNDIKSPIMESILYWENSYGEMNRKCETYYYVIPINTEPDLSKIKLTEREKKNNFHIDKVLIKDSIQILTDNLPKNYINNFITPDMIEAINEYLKCETK